MENLVEKIGFALVAVLTSLAIYWVLSDINRLHGGLLV